jgi:hypothetical protein
MKSIDKKILEELARHNSINKYITEQEAEVGVEPTAEVGAEIPTEDPMLEPAEEPTPEVIDVTQDDEVMKIDDSGNSEETESGSEEIDITDLVNSQKNMESKQNEYFDMMFKQLEGLQGKLSEMESLVDKLNSIEAKVEKYRPKTPQEKLELRSLDSGPFHQKLTDFFDDKQQDMEKAGKNEYVLTSDEVEQIVPSEIKKSFDSSLPEPTDTRFGMR